MPSEGEHAPELLRADKEQLDRAAALLGGEDRAFVIAVCPKELVAAVREHMAKQAGVAVPEPVVLQGSEEALEALLGVLPEVAGATVRSLALGGEMKETLRALNWHREKLLKGAPVVLWIDGVDGLTEMREAAPDAYAFRDVVVMVRGDGGRLPQIPYQESRRILEARRRVARAKTALERARAYAQLSDGFRIHDHLIEAETAARRGLDALPMAKYTDESARNARADLWYRIAVSAGERGSQVRQREATRTGLNEINDIHRGTAQEHRAWLLAQAPGPVGRSDRASVEQASVLNKEFGKDRELSSQVTRALAQTAAWRGDIARARRLLGEFDLANAVRVNASFVRGDQSEVERAAGRMLAAENYLLQAIAINHRDEADIPAFAMLFAACWLERGEVETAERIIEESSAQWKPDREPEKRLVWGTLEAARGNIARAQHDVRIALRDSASLGLDRRHVHAAGQFAEVTVAAYETERFDAPMLHKVAAELEVAEDVSRSLSNNDPPPWYPIWFLSYRADLLIRTDRHAEALTLARRALDLAHTTCEDLIPETGRTLADHFLRTGNADEALPLLADVEPEAISRGMLKELARIRAARVLALVLRNEPPSAVEPAMAALREALESTGAPRIKAETLQELAIRLPPATTLPDPLALASETHTLFVEMPMPAKEARSLELAGDVLAARGKPADARRRYLTAHGILERRGLGLRIPLITTKIQRLG